MSADEIETALISPNNSLAKLHITLLKGIPPVNNKHLSSPDGWVTSLCKKLEEWWPWVADGEIPLIAGKGMEISKYEELDPTIRLLMLKALCELRTEQDDLIAYINDALKEGTNLSHFRKTKISETKTGVSYWYDGNSVIGHRLYREVNKPQPKPKHRGKCCFDPPLTNLEWETLATNLDEFREISEELSSSSDVVEGAVYQTIETEIIPVLEKLQKKRERDLKRKQREEALLNGYHSYAAGPTRTCRTRKPVKYTFDEYDRSIDEAIKLTREMKDRKVAKNGTKHRDDGKKGSDASDEDSRKNAHSEKGSPGFIDKDVQMDELRVEDSDDDEGANRRNHAGATLIFRGKSDFLSTRMEIKNSSDSSSDHCPEEVKNMRAKNRLRQRPIRNSAVDSDFAADTDHGNSSENASVDADDGNASENVSVDADDGNSSENVSVDANDGNSSENSSLVSDSEGEPLQVSDSEDDLSS